MAGVIALLAVPLFGARPPRRGRVSPARHAAGITQRKRLHINDIIAAPGTLELDWGALYSLNTSFFTAPSALKFTPRGASLLAGRTEYSVAFDSVASELYSGSRATHFSDRLTFASTTVLFDSEHLDIAAGPQVTTFLRAESGARLGAAALATYDRGLNSLGASLAWSGATTASDANPAGVWDVTAGYGRQLASSGPAGRFTLHVTSQVERATGFAASLALFAGVEYQISRRLALDFSGQQYGVTGGNSDRQVMVSLTASIGRTR